MNHSPPPLAGMGSALAIGMGSALAIGMGSALAIGMGSALAIGRGVGGGGRMEILEQL